MDIMVQKLKNLNFSELEAITYLTLLKKSPLTGHAIAQETNIDKSQIYIVLEGLINKGCIVASENKHTQYVPISYNIFLDRYAKDAVKKRNYALNLVNELKEKQTAEIEVINSLYRVKDIYNKLNELIANADKAITLRIWNEDLYYIEKSLENAYLRGLKITVAVFGEYRNDIIPVYSVDYMTWSQENINYRFIKIDIDFNIIFCACISNIFQTYATWTSNKMLYNIIHTSIIYDVTLCRTYESYPEDLRLKWAEYMMIVRKKYS